jgi:hypothetical protein
MTRVRHRTPLDFRADARLSILPGTLLENSLAVSARDGACGEGGQTRPSEGLRRRRGTGKPSHLSVFECGGSTFFIWGACKRSMPSPWGYSTPSSQPTGSPLPCWRSGTGVRPLVYSADSSSGCSSIFGGLYQGTSGPVGPTGQLPPLSSKFTITADLYLTAADGHLSPSFILR